MHMQYTVLELSETTNHFIMVTLHLEMLDEDQNSMQDEDLSYNYKLRTTGLPATELTELL